MSKPFLSIIVPAYKTENTIVRCLDSIFSQIEGNALGDMVEVCAVNDCSPDNAGKKLDEYRRRHPALKVIHHSVNGGEAGAHNTGMEATVGEYFLRLDSDDALRPGAILRLFEILGESKPDLLLHTYVDVDENGKRISCWHLPCSRLFDIFSDKERDVKEIFFWGAFGIMTPSVVYRRAVAPDLRQEADFPISEDRYFGWRFFARAKTIYLLDEPLVDYYHYPNSLSHTHSDKAVEGLLELDMRFWREMQRHPQFTRGGKYAFRRLFSGFVGWHYELVFLSEPEKRKFADLYFDTLGVFLEGGASLRELGLMHVYLKSVYRLRSRRLMELYRAVFYKFVWPAERKLKRIAKGFLMPRVTFAKSAKC